MLRRRDDRLREITAQAIDEVGRLARGLHPTVLDDHGLGVALSRYVAEYSKTHNIAVDLTLSEFDSSNLPSAVQIGLYRILQEALTNVARHSGAKAGQHRFARSAKALEVAVIDNGCGFDAEWPWLSPRIAWGFRVCEKERQCWAERSVSRPRARGPGFWCKSHLPTWNLSPRWGGAST